jgi:hypothetical protein
MDMCKVVVTLRITKSRSVGSPILGGPCSRTVLSSSSGESGITRTCSALLLSLCGENHGRWQPWRSGEKRWEPPGAGEDDENPISKSPRPGPPEVVVSRTHPYTHTHTYISLISFSVLYTVLFRTLLVTNPSLSIWSTKHKVLLPNNLTASMFR